jgi:hypothetical protein
MLIFFTNLKEFELFLQGTYQNYHFFQNSMKNKKAVVAMLHLVAILHYVEKRMHG